MAEKKKKPAVNNLVAKHAPKSGAGPHQLKGGKKASRAKQKAEGRKYSLMDSIDTNRQIIEGLQSVQSSDEMHSYLGFVTMWAKQALTKAFSSPEERDQYIDKIVDRSIDAVEAGLIIDISPELAEMVVPENKEKIKKDILAKIMMMQ